MVNSNHKMSEKEMCPFWNVGFCKFKDNCRKEHAKSDCKEKQCDKIICKSRHRRRCKYNDGCKYLRTKTCQFLHMNGKQSQVKNNTMNDEKIKKHLSDIEQLEQDVKGLK